MKDCCASCDYSEYNQEYTKPYICKVERPYKRLSCEQASNNKCNKFTYHGETIKSIADYIGKEGSDILNGSSET